MYLFDRFYIDRYVLRRIALALGLGLIGVLAAVTIVTGKDPVTLATTKAAVKPHCSAYAVDVGGSTSRTGDTSVRQTYLEFMSGRLKHGADTHAVVYIGYFAGTPPEGTLAPLHFDAAAESDFTGGIDSANTLAQAQADLSANLERPEVKTNGSAVIATAGYLAANTPAGCDITLVSDGIESSELASFAIGGHTRLVGAGAIPALLERLKHKKMIPDLRGRRLVMPQIGATAGPGPGQRFQRLRRRDATREFWKAFAVAAKTTLTTSG